MTSEAASRRTVFSIQILRGLAALLVVCRHAAKHVYPLSPFSVGQAGVDIFFVISGVVIFMAGRSLSWDQFLRRRIARIVPLYWLATAAAVVAGAIAAVLARGTTPLRLGNVIASFFFIPAVDRNGNILPIIVAGWTLNFEAYFYAVCAIVLATPARRHFVETVSAIIAAGIGIGIVCYWGQGLRPALAPGNLLLPITIEFVAGMWLARAWTAGIRTPGWCNLLLIIAAMLWLAEAPSYGPYSLWRPLGWGVPALAIVWAAMASEDRIPFARFRAGLRLGDASYALYLVHPFVLAAGFGILARVPVAISAPLRMTIGVAVCVIAGILLHLVIERRLVRMAGAVLGPGRRSPAPGALESAVMAQGMPPN